jgi:ZIP family zinc transporter
MFLAAGWSILAASSLLVGMLIALVWRAPKPLVGVVLAFGAGALLSAITFELVDEAIADGSERELAIGMLVGAAVFVVGSRLLRSKTSSSEPDAAEDSRSIVLGATLDGIPESLAIGGAVQAAGGGSMSTTLLVAVALSNLPEAMGATAGMRASGIATWRIVATWAGLVLVSGIAAAIGYVAFAHTGDIFGARLNAFAAGAVMAMLTDTMVPDAYRDAGRTAGFATVVGFALAFLIS